MREIMEITEQLGQAVQKKTQGIVNAVRLGQSTKILLEKIRSDDGWGTIVENGTPLALEIFKGPYTTPR
jgi:hypothetical protein